MLEGIKYEKKERKSLKDSSLPKSKIKMYLLSVPFGKYSYLIKQLSVVVHNVCL